MRKKTENRRSMNFKNTVNFILIVALVASPITLAVFEKTCAALLSLIALSFALVFWNLDNFPNLRGLALPQNLIQLFLKHTLLLMR